MNLLDHIRECYSFAIPERKTYQTDHGKLYGRNEPNMDILPFVVAVAIACFLLVLSGLVRHWGMIG